MIESIKKNKRLKLGFIGGGLSSAIGQTHFSASQLDGHWELVAGAFSHNQITNIETSKAWNIDSSRVYNKWQDLIESEKNKLDAVVVLLPTPMHKDVILELFKANIPVISEKALTASKEDVFELKKFYDENKHFLAVTYNYSGYPIVRELQYLIESGDLGDIQQIHLEMPQEGFIRPPAIAGKLKPPQSWRLKDGKIPTICLDLGVHLHHLSNFLLGTEPSSVSAEFKHYSNYENIVDNVMMWLRYDNGISSSFWMSKTAIGNRNGLKIRILGDKATAEWVQVNSEELRISYIDGSHIIIDRGGKSKVCSQSRYNRMKVGHPSGFIEAFANLYGDIAESLIEWKKAGVYSNKFVYGLEHSFKGLILFDRARDSFNGNGKWVKIEDK